MIPIQVISNEYRWKEKSIKSISASASRNSAGVTHISLVNMDPNQAQTIEIGLGSINAKNVTGRILDSEKMQDHNSFTELEKVKPVAFTGAVLNNNQLKVTLPAGSVVVLAIQ